MKSLPFGEEKGNFEAESEKRETKKDIGGGGWEEERERLMLLLIDYLTFQQHAGVSQGLIFSVSCLCCYTEIEVADQTYLTQSKYTDTGPARPSTDPITSDSWQGNHWGTSF